MTSSLAAAGKKFDSRTSSSRTVRIRWKSLGVRSGMIAGRLWLMVVLTEEWATPTIDTTPRPRHCSGSIIILRAGSGVLKSMAIVACLKRPPAEMTGRGGVRSQKRINSSVGLQGTVMSPISIGETLLCE